MYQFIKIKGNENVVRLKVLYKEEQRLSFKEVFELWHSDPSFTKFYTRELLTFLGNAIFWEHPPLLTENLDEEYEVILCRATSFDKKEVNEKAFEDHFEKGKLVAVFDNLGKNARLVVPVKIKSANIYKHLGVFLENADLVQVFSLFKAVSTQLNSELESGKRIWLNTAGMGILWLHIRLDTRPKYYKTQRYKEIDFFDKK